MKFLKLPSLGLVSTLLLIGTLFLSVPVSHAETMMWKPVPLTQTDAQARPILASPDGRRFAYRSRNNKSPIALPKDFIPQARVSVGAGRWLVLGRQAIQGDIAAVLLDDSRAVSLKIDERLSKSLYYFHGFSAFGKPHLLAYDVDETMPSGRSSKVVKDGVDLFQLSLDRGELKLEKKADKLPLSGMDARYQDKRVGDDHLLCAQAACLVLSTSSDGTITHKELRRPEWASRSLVEWQGDKMLRGLFRLDFDDRFRAPPKDDEIIYKDCGIWPEGGCVDVRAGQLPAGYQADGKLASISSCADIEAVLRKDLLNMPGHGLTFLGMNNYEGRIPWGQVYVLDGMLDVIERLALPQKRFDALRENMRQRVAMELLWWDRLMQTGKPWLWSRRYSLERADIVSAVHLGRMARVAGRAQQIGLHVPANLITGLAHLVTKLDQTIEEVKGKQLVMRKGVPFNLDGSNSAWNIQSGWIEGFAALTKTAIINESSKQAAINMVRDFIATEITEKKPDLWQYCAGLCQEGWKAEDGVSVNMPVWEGNKTRTASAHVSYRSMDARAVLEAMAVWKLEGLEWFPGYISGLVEKGWLYPMTIAPLAKHGARPNLSAASIASFGRSAIPFDLHNQIWALEAVASKPEMCGR